MADATTAARDRIDQALALLEKRIDDLKGAPAAPDDDLFALPTSPGSPSAEKARIAELEAAGREASAALARAAEALRTILAGTAD
ncbi:hypothetical protein BZG35_13905 [Brevundimonas sp. LM2]|uniref:hypothetical protein n=1 Tax=Brevundimonas sp. LM2 TaxID=1938605 RepID=UPI000983C6E8|nr:hypothetical protein [Brevundimonas sp. LM2]AQR62617.1 hypothetical protein BZG35_13905 [Brevundimonas sp. LM2]